MSVTFCSFLKKHQRIIFYSSWLLIHLIQSGATELFDDEAYYWMYSVFPAWGYFDHPPMIAMLIKAGYAIFHNELGVRLFTVFLSTASIWLIETLIDKKNTVLFYTICASLALAQIGGMMAVPDTPLMFFVALFFWMYRRFVEKMNVLNAVLLGMTIALMLFTKYHGVLIVLFTGISNLKLLRYYQTYIVILVSVILFIPHVYWQYQNGFPSVQFHLFERNAVSYDLRTSLEFIGGQVLLAGPLMGWLLILAALLYKPASVTEKALRYTFIGIYTFFLLSTLKGKAEANWTIPSFIGMIVLSHQYLRDHERWSGWLYRIVPLTLLLVLVVRIYMMVDTPPATWIAKDEFHYNRTWVNAISREAGKLPVVFIDSYQKPSKYWYYSGNKAMALNTPGYRRNNYNFWPIEDSLINKPVYVVGAHDPVFFSTVFPVVQLEKNGGRMIANYYSFSRVLIDEVKAGKADKGQIGVRFRVITPAAYLPWFQQAPFDTATIQLAVFQKKKLVAYLPSRIAVKDIKNAIQRNAALFNLAIPAGAYTGKFAINSCISGLPSLNSSGFDFVVQ